MYFSNLMISFPTWWWRIYTLYPIINTNKRVAEQHTLQGLQNLRLHYLVKMEIGCFNHMRLFNILDNTGFIWFTNQRCLSENYT